MSSTIDPRPGELDELERRQADRPGADDQARTRPAAGAPRLTAWQPMASVSTSASCSNVSVSTRCSLRAGTRKCGPQPAVAVDAEHLSFSQQLGWPRRQA